MLYFFFLKLLFFFNEAMILDTKLFFFVFFVLKVHTFKFYIMHKSISNKKNDLYKAQKC